MCVLDILDAGTVFQVVCPVIPFIAVLMVNNMAFFIACTKGFCNKSVYLKISMS
jgi:hypothetical protein